MALVVCAIEGPCMVLFALALAAGLYGPFAVDVRVANIAFNAIEGCGTLTTFILALHLHEECNAVYIHGHQRRPVLRHFRGIIAVAACWTAGGDFISGALSVSSFYLVHRCTR